MKGPKVIFLLVAVQLLVCGSATAQDIINNAGIEKRLALVIGNSKYTNSMELSNPVNDARAMKLALQKGGFDVDEYENL